MNSLRIAYIVQRYGLEVNGGSETHCRLLAERMARKHRVDVITTCAVDYVTWRDEYAEGLTEINGVSVRRFRVDHPREPGAFAKCSQLVFGAPHTRADEIAWMKQQGPYSSRLFRYIEANHAAYDVFLFQTYLYCTTYFGLPLVADRAILVPTAHNEPPIYLQVFDAVFERARHFICLTPEELSFLRRRFYHCALKADVLGIGVDLGQPLSGPNREWDSIRTRLADSPYILYLGRIDESKGCRTLMEYFTRYRAHSVGETDLKLLLVGKPVMTIPDDPAIIAAGFVSEDTKAHAIQGSRAMVVPSEYESLCIAALEGWAHSKPILANGRCGVLRGQCIRTNGGLWYADYEEFREGLNCLLTDQGLASTLGRCGQSFVRDHYTWAHVDGKLADVLDSVASPRPYAATTSA